VSRFFKSVDESDPDLDMPFWDQPCIWELQPVYHGRDTPARAPESVYTDDLPSDDDEDTWMTIYEDHKGRRSKRAFIR
jgi:hypothetical protein